jgi:uncharacterized protein (DUF1501 family)
MKRRELLQAASALMLAEPMGRLWAVPTAGGAKFVLVFLRGAYDATNFLVPYSSDFYYASRPGIAVPRPGSGPDAALELDADWALHPAAADSLLPLWRTRQIAFVPYAGTLDLTRSHFETQDHIELGQGGVTRDFNDGFLNRLVRALGGRAKPMAFTAQLPLCLRGTADVANMVIDGADRGVLDAREETLLEAMWAGTPEAAAVREGFAVRAQVRRDLQAMDERPEMIAASRGAVAPRAFVAEAERIGGLMRDSFDIGFVDVGGWDTHVNEAGANGAHGQLADKLGALTQGLAAMSRAMGPAWRDTIVVVISEFGRTFRENGNRGTDHGHGTVYWVLGGAVRGGRIAGEQVVLSPQTLNQNRDYPALTEDRALLGGLFARLWALSPSVIQAVFPQSRPRDLQLV